MGYTHQYGFTKNPSQKKWNEFIKVIKKMAENIPKHSESSGGYYNDKPLVLTGCSMSEEPLINTKVIFVNGKGDLGHETFYLRPEKQSLFCKTCRKPYDLFVQATLLIANKHFGKSFEIKLSDGWKDDWEVALEFASKFMDGLEIPDTIDENPHEK